VQDIRAFQDAVLLRGLSNSTPTGTVAWSSAALVALHNLVTASIDKRFNGKRRHFYCAWEVPDKLRSSLIFDATPIELPAAHAGVLGLGWHDIKNCTPSRP